MRIIQTLTAVAVLSSTLVLQGEDLLPLNRPIPEVIDHYVDLRIEEDKVTAAPPIDDSNLIRRLMLDLDGRIPTSAEVRAFVASDSESKRMELVDNLLAGAGFTFHHRNELQALLEYPARRNDGEFRKYLLWAAKENRSWDNMFRDMIIGDENDENQKAALSFLTHRAKNLDDVTNDTASLFFGVNVSCAKCHDHPLVEDWKQDHYFGMQSFFSRTYLTKKNSVGEKFYGQVKFTTTKGVEKQARFMFLSGSVVEDGTKELTDDERKKHDEQVKKLQKDDKAGPAPKPKFSPRQKLVEVALQDSDHAFFSRNITNRIWYRLLGRGIVDPPDQLHSENSPSHPELLDWLARDLAANGYDLKRLIRGIVLSQAYSRSSEWNSESEQPGSEYFAVAVSRPMSPRQYGASLLVATRNPSHWDQWLEKSEAEWAKEREGLENTANNWASQFELPGERFQVAVDEALFFSNNDRIQNDLLRDSGDRLLGTLKETEDDKAAIEIAFQAICSRSPTDDELAAIGGYLETRSADRVGALKQIVWALVTGPELRFNY